LVLFQDLGAADFSKFVLNFAMASGRAWPPKPSDSSKRKACKIASREYEKMARKDFAIKKVMSRMTTAGTNGCVTFF